MRAASSDEYPEEVDQHEGRSLTRREPEEHPADVGPDIGFLEGVSVLDGRGQLPQRQRGPPASHPEAVQRRAEQIGLGVLDPRDLVPSLPELEERVLHELLGVVAIARHEVQGPEEPLVLVGEERVEPNGGDRGRQVPLRRLAARLHGP